MGEEALVHVVADAWDAVEPGIRPLVGLVALSVCEDGLSCWRERIKAGQTKHLDFQCPPAMRFLQCSALHTTFS